MVTSFLKQLSCTPGYRIAQKFVSVIEDELSMKIDVRTSFSLLFAIQFLIGCQRTIRDGPIVIGYKNAVCIPVHIGPGIKPPTRAWDFTITTSKGLTVRIQGATMPGGQVTIKYLPEEVEIVAANAGDYIYPTDVRLNSGSDVLFIKASGITAAFSQPQTWLFAYDLNSRKQIMRERVDPSVLPAECKVE